MAIFHGRAAIMTSALFFALWLSFSGSDAATSTTFIYEKNGVRLVGGDATKGRLEVRPDSAAGRSWITKDWVQVCDDMYSDDGLAERMCQTLGYKYGREYYSPELNFPENATQFKAGYVTCDRKYSGAGSGGRHVRRLLRSGAASDDGAGLEAAGAYKGNDDPAAGAVTDGRRGRSLLSPWWGYIGFPESSPYSCRFRLGTCNPVGPVTAIQCSNRTFQPAPPPPPSPPSPPPPPPAVSNLIRIVGGFWGADAPLEPNLCATTEAGELCRSHARVEIQVDSPNKRAPGKIWAPVCNITNPTFADAVAELACEQRFQERARPWLPNIWYIWGDVSRTPLRIPAAGKGNATKPGDFNPKAVRGWVTISSGDANTATKLQDLKYKVSSTPCAKNAMLTISCQLASNDAAIP